MAEWRWVGGGAIPIRHIARDYSAWSLEVCRGINSELVVNVS